MSTPAIRLITDKPHILISPNLFENVDQAIEALRFDRTLFQRDGKLVHVIQSPEANQRVAKGTPQIREVPLAQLKDRLSRMAVFESYDGRSGKMEQRLPPNAVVHAVAARGEWAGVLPLVGVLEAPAMRPDGSIIQAPGYDPSTGFLLIPSYRDRDVQESPTQEHAKAALKALREPFEDFPFESEASLSALLSVVLTMLARPAILGSVPAVLLDANVRGAGKSLATDVISTIATGRPTAKMSYPSDSTELEKVLAGYALRGAALINFDNITTPFGGGPLDRVLTATDRVELRVLGKSEVPEIQWRAVVIGTGNNITITGDTARRSMLARIQSDLERPEERTGFEHPDLIGWVRQHRPRFVRAALTILRAYVVAGRPDVGVRPWGSFGPWAELVPGALIYAGADDPTQARPTDDEHADPETQAAKTIIALLPRLSDEGATAKTIISSLYSREQLRGEAAPDGFDELREAIEVLVPARPGQAPCHRRLGNRLRGLRGRVIEGYRLVHKKSGRNRINAWHVESVRHVRHVEHVSEVGPQ